MSIAKHLQQLTQIDWREVRVVPHIRRYINLYLALLQAGFALPDLLPSLRCALTAPFHPYFLKRKLLKKRSIFCGTFRKFTLPRRYLALYPKEPGLSSKKQHAV